MQQTPLVSVVVLNYNGLRHLNDCFSSPAAVDYPDDCLEILLVDNGSHDDSLSHVRAHDPNVGIVANDANVGFSGGNSRGAERYSAHGRRSASNVRAPAHQRYPPVQRRGCHGRMARHGGDGCRLCSGVPGEPAGSRLAASNVTGSRRTAARTDNRMGRHDGGAMTRWRIG
jgi:hypothetical protein